MGHSSTTASRSGNASGELRVTPVLHIELPYFVMAASIRNEHDGSTIHGPGRISIVRPSRAGDAFTNSSGRGNQIQVAAELSDGNSFIHDQVVRGPSRGMILAMRRVTRNWTGRSAGSRGSRNLRDVGRVVSSPAEIDPFTCSPSWVEIDATLRKRSDRPVGDTDRMNSVFYSAGGTGGRVGRGDERPVLAPCRTVIVSPPPDAGQPLDRKRSQVEHDKMARIQIRRIDISNRIVSG